MGRQGSIHLAGLPMAMKMTSVAIMSQSLVYSTCSINIRHKNVCSVSNSGLSINARGQF